MKEFDYEKAKAGAPVCTRDGRPARIVCWDAIGEQLPILALVTEGDIIGELSEFTYWYNEKGKSDDDYESDLMMAPVKREGWINIYKDEDGLPESGGRIWKDKESAQDVTQDNESYIATVKIEWEE